jgi:hypothetical protein
MHISNYVHSFKNHVISLHNMLSFHIRYMCDIQFHKISIVITIVIISKIYGCCNSTMSFRRTMCNA